MVVFGALKFLILKVILSEELNGNQISKVISEKTGWKVSCGSIYPALDDLTNKELVQSKKNKTTHIYTITDKGKQFLKDADKKKEDIFKKIIEGVNLLGVLEDGDGTGKFIEKHLKSDLTDDFFLCKELVEIKKELSRVDKKKYHYAIEKILKNTKERLRKLR